MNKKCPICGEYIYSWQKHHVCDPIWSVKIADPNFCDDEKEVRAHDAQEAAEIFIQWWDHDGADYICINGDPVTVTVQKNGEQDILTFVVTGEMIPQYHAEWQQEDK